MHYGWICSETWTGNFRIDRPNVDHRDGEHQKFTVNALHLGLNSLNLTMVSVVVIFLRELWIPVRSGKCTRRTIVWRWKSISPSKRPRWTENANISSLIRILPARWKPCTMKWCFFSWKVILQNIVVVAVPIPSIYTNNNRSTPLASWHLNPLLWGEVYIMIPRLASLV